ncbi:MAG: NAD-glutamate dehydrogenase [Solirubrobacterales bacterium]|nr:NAD-glutamate dehydrogenase [Solirubrobacterales bacterium]
MHGELTADVLRGSSAAGDVDARLDAFTDGNAAALDRCQTVLADIRASGTHDLTTLPVALRELRNLIQSTAPVADVER